MSAFFIYNSSKVRDKNLLFKVNASESEVHHVDINQGLERQLVGYIGVLPLQDLTNIIDDRLVSNYNLDENQRLVQYIDKHPNVIKTPILITEDKVEVIASQQDLVNSLSTT